MVAHGLQDDTSEFLKNDKVFINDIELFSVLEFTLEEPDFFEIVQLAAYRIYLLAELSRQLTDEILIVGMKEKERKELNAGTRGE